MNDFITTASTPAEADSPARAEYQAILTDPNHRLHGPLMRGDAEANAYIDRLYQKYHGGPNGTPSNEAGPDPQPPLLTREERVAGEQSEAELRRAFGDAYDSVVTDANHAVDALFTTPEAVEVYRLVAAEVEKRGQQAVILSLRFLADLGQLARNQR